MNEEVEQLNFEYMIDKIVPKDGSNIDLDINGKIITLSKKGKFYFVQSWGWTTTFGLYKYFKDIHENM